MKTKLLIATAIIALLFTSCIDDYIIRGNGIAESESRLVSAFSSIASEGNFQIHIMPGDTYEVLVHAESNLLPFIQTDVNGHNLKIHVQGVQSLQNQLPIEVYVTVPFIEEIIQSGSGSITTAWFEGEAFRFVVSGSGSINSSIETDLVEVILSGSGTMYLTGVGRDASLIISGSGRVDTWDFSVRNCDAKISGSGDVWIDVETYLKAVITGSGNVFYSGTPVVETVVSGSGGVFHKN